MIITICGSVSMPSVLAARLLNDLRSRTELSANSRFLMIDPKVVELGIYNGIPQLLVPVVTDPKKAAGRDHLVRDLNAHRRLVGDWGFNAHPCGCEVERDGFRNESPPPTTD